MSPLHHQLVSFGSTRLMPRQQRLCHCAAPSAAAAPLASSGSESCAVAVARHRAARHRAAARCQTALSWRTVRQATEQLQVRVLLAGTALSLCADLELSSSPERPAVEQPKHLVRLPSATKAASPSWCGACEAATTDGMAQMCRRCTGAEAVVTQEAKQEKGRRGRPAPRRHGCNGTAMGPNQQQPPS